jgi:hypothetical protein
VDIFGTDLDHMLWLPDVIGVMGGPVEIASYPACAASGLLMQVLS